MAAPSLLRPLAAGLLALISVLPAAGAPGNFVQLTDLTSALSSPVGVTNAGDGSNRLFIVEQCGRIRIWNGSALLPTPFLNLGATGSDVILCGGERGLLGLAFHPDYAANGRFYVFYTRKSDGDVVIARYQVSADPNVANPAGTPLLTIEHTSVPNHNGGHLAFGPDGYLYISVGDAGNGAGAQSVNTLTGKILRIDVDSGTLYGIPATNPFAGAKAGADEVWAYGLRNPWQFSFDRSTGDLYIGDVGQLTWEEIDFQPADTAGDGGGRNYGWDCREGAHDYAGATTTGCGAIPSTNPILEYGHSPECSVTGGYVFRNLPSHSYHGNYLFGDLCSTRIWRGISDGTGGWTSQQISVPTFAGASLTSFGESESGRIYLTYLSGALRWLAPYTFQDLPPTHWAWPYVEALFAGGITLGCETTPRYCPDTAATRADVAVFLVRALHGAAFVPPPPTGVFADVPTGHRAAAHIEQLYHDGITNGCATAPLRYCPDVAVTRADIAPFLVRVRHGAGFTPPAVGSPSFADVPAGFWAAPWIEQLYQDGGTNGCATSPLRYCPASNVTRAEAAGFIAKTFDLPLP